MIPWFRLTSLSSSFRGAPKVSLPRSSISKDKKKVEISRKMMWPLNFFILRDRFLCLRHFWCALDEVRGVSVHLDSRVEILHYVGRQLRSVKNVYNSRAGELREHGVKIPFPPKKIKIYVKLLKF